MGCGSNFIDFKRGEVLAKIEGLPRTLLMVLFCRLDDLYLGKKEETRGEIFPMRVFPDRGKRYCSVEPI